MNPMTGPASAGWPALSSGLSTRLGTALRHAGELIGHASSFRKLVIVLTDGEPSDIDVADPLDLVEDARRAAVGLRARGIDGFGVVMGSDAMTSAVRDFRTRQYHAGAPRRGFAEPAVGTVFPAGAALTL